MANKLIIGMIHLKPLPTSPNNKYSVDEIIYYALRDLKTLEEAGIEYAIVENVFDTPYSTKISMELMVTFTHIFTVLENNTKINLGVNIHATSGTEEMLVASVCGAQFIRAESFVEHRHTSTGLLKPMAADLMRTKARMHSDVKVFADVNVKESRPVYAQNIEETIPEALAAGADAIIVTGLATGKPPLPSEIKNLKELTPDKPLLIGSGVSAENISELMKYADGVIVGSSIKEDGDITKPVSLERTVELLDKI